MAGGAAPRVTGEKHGIGNIEGRPAVARLLEVMCIDGDDIADSSVKRFEGEITPGDVGRAADAWIAADQKLFDGWLAPARAAGAEAR